MAAPDSPQYTDPVSASGSPADRRREMAIMIEQTFEMNFDVRCLDRAAPSGIGKRGGVAAEQPVDGARRRARVAGGIAFAIVRSDEIRCAAFIRNDKIGREHV